jgi:flagellar hook assembly protein FlgD
MLWLSVVFDEGARVSESFSLKSSDSTEIEMNFEGKDIGYYKIFLPEFSGQGVFVQILDQNQNVISDEIVETKMSVGYFDFELGGTYVAKITNLSNNQINLEVEFGDTNGREMIVPGIITLAGGLMIVIGSYIKLRDYRIEQPDENIS